MTQNSKTKLTPWFPRKSHPAREGVFQRLLPHGKVVFSYWDGRRWGPVSSSSAVEASAWRLGFSGWSRKQLPWRGLIEQPKEGAK